MDKSKQRACLDVVEGDLQSPEDLARLSAALRKDGLPKTKLVWSLLLDEWQFVAIPSYGVCAMGTKAFDDFVDSLSVKPN